MKFSRPDARLFVPDGVPEIAALERITALGIGAHADDLEFMAFHGIGGCYRQETKWFGGVTCTDGGGSPRTGPFAGLDDAAMRAIRIREQETAATLGEYAAVIQLAHPSGAVKNPADPSLKADLLEILTATRPEVVYTHNPADKHETHVAVAVATLLAIRAMPPADRPQQVHGCEVWRGLDWMGDDEKIRHDVSAHEPLAAALHGVFESQIGGGKRYDLAVPGRWRANATFGDSHAADDAEMIAFAMDLTPLIHDDAPDPVDYVAGFIRRFEESVRTNLRRHLAAGRG